MHAKTQKLEIKPTNQFSVKCKPLISSSKNTCGFLLKIKQSIQDSKIIL